MGFSRPCSSKSQIRASLTSNLLQLPLLGELLVQLLQLLDDVGTGLDDGVLGADLSVGLDAQLDRGEEWMRRLVGCEQDVWRLDEVMAEKVADGVVLLVQSEESRIGDALREC